MEKYYPEADSWMWNYCIFLGQFTASNGKKYDLGIHRNHHESSKVRQDLECISAAIVDGNEAGDYYSGELDGRTFSNSSTYDEKYIETIKRAEAAGYTINNYVIES